MAVKEISIRSREKQKKINGHWSNKELECSLCGTIYVKSGPNQKYCSKRCQNKFHFKKKMKNIQYKLRHNLRSRLRKTLHGKAHGLSPVRHLGCSVEDLKLYLESKWQTGMNWKNYDLLGLLRFHFKSLNSFNLSCQDEFLNACQYTNLQPLWAKDNLSKGADSPILKL